MTDIKQNPIDPREEILSQIDSCTSQRGFLLNGIQLTTELENHDVHEFLNLALQVTDCDLALCWKTLEYNDDRISGQEYMRWRANNFAVRQKPLIELRDFLENKSEKMFSESFEWQPFAERLLPMLKDSVLKHAHDLEQFGAIMAKDESLVVPETVVHYDGHPIRCSRLPGGGILLDASDMVAVVRIIAGEIQSMAEQPHLDTDKAIKEYDRVISRLLLTPEMDRFVEWAKTILDGNRTDTGSVGKIF